MRHLVAVALGLAVAACGAKPSTDPGAKSGDLSGRNPVPLLLATAPEQDARQVPADVVLHLTFDQPVELGEEWLQLLCSSGSVPVAAMHVTGGPTEWDVDPFGLPEGEHCLLLVIGSQVTAVGSGQAAPFDASIGFVVAGAPPSAKPDAFLVDIRNGLRTEDDALILNDTRGSFPAIVVSFGGGSLGGTVDDIPSDNAVRLGDDGAMMVTSEGGLLFLPPTGLMEDVTFSYRIANYEGVSQAEVTLTLGTSPMPDGDNEYLMRAGSTLSVSAAEGVLANDDVGAPAAAIVGFGGGDLGSDPVAFSPGDLATFDDGTVQLNADGSFSLSVNDGFRGQVVFAYVLENVHGAYYNFVAVTVLAPPIATADVFADCVGNTQVAAGGTAVPGAVNFAGGLLANDVAGSGPGPLVALAGVVVTAQGGSAAVAADGSFVYTPPLGYTGSDSFGYTVSDGFLTASSTAAITLAGRVWYVAAGAGGDGRSTTPLGTVAAAVSAASASGDVIYLSGPGSYPSSTLTIATGRSVIGSGAALAVQAGATLRTLLAAGTRPTLQARVVLSANTALRGVHLEATATALAANGASGLAVSQVSVACPACAPAIDLQDFGGDLSIDGIGSVGSLASLVDGTGSVTIGSASSPSTSESTVTPSITAQNLTSLTLRGLRLSTDDTVAALVSVTQVLALTLDDVELGGASGNAKTGLEYASSAGSATVDIVNGSRFYDLTDYGIDMLFDSASASTVTVQDGFFQDLGTGLRFRAPGTSTGNHSLALVRNQVTPIAAGLEVAAAGSGDLRVAIATNTITGGTGVGVLGTVAGTRVASFDVSGNTLTAMVGNALQLGGSDSVIVHLPGYAGPTTGAPAEAAAATYLQARNGGAAPTVVSLTGSASVSP